MKINKQLFEDVLSGKLKGKFVLRNGSIISSDWLKRAQQNKVTVIAAQTYPYILEGKYYSYYTENGQYIDGYTHHNLDIIDFIPETDMKENELTIEIPEGQEIDWQKSAKQEKIVFKKKEDTKPRSWEEYCANTKRNGKYFIGPTSDIVKSYCCEGESFDIRCDKNLLPSKELAKAFLAMTQLMSLRQAWIGDWEPDWSNECLDKYCIIGIHLNFTVCLFNKYRYPLSFPKREMAEDFMNCFKDLLEVAKPLV